MGRWPPSQIFEKKNLSSIDFILNLQVDRQSTPLCSLKILGKSVSQKSRKLSLNILVGQILRSIIWRLACHRATIFSLSLPSPLLPSPFPFPPFPPPLPVPLPVRRANCLMLPTLGIIVDRTHERDIWTDGQTKRQTDRQIVDDSKNRVYA